MFGNREIAMANIANIPPRLDEDDANELTNILQLQQEREAEEQEQADKRDTAANDAKKASREEILHEQDFDDLESMIRESVAEMKSLDGDGKTINSQRSVVRDKLESRGISRRAFAMAVSISKMTEEQLDGFFVALQICCKAIDRPIQTDMFLNYKNEVSKSSE